QNDVTLKMPAFEWVHVQLHQQKGMISLSPPTICNSAALYDAVASGTKELYEEADACHYDIYEGAFFERVAAVQTQWFKKHL
ncbi:hypothetical protein QS654_25785, partial [Escherichia coli]|nr:hypothetical protein [Escherichia coli]